MDVSRKSVRNIEKKKKIGFSHALSSKETQTAHGKRKKLSNNDQSHTRLMHMRYGYLTTVSSRSCKAFSPFGVIELRLNNASTILLWLILLRIGIFIIDKEVRPRLMVLIHSNTITLKILIHGRTLVYYTTLFCIICHLSRTYQVKQWLGWTPGVCL